MQNGIDSLRMEDGMGQGFLHSLSRVDGARVHAIFVHGLRQALNGPILGRVVGAGHKRRQAATLT